MKKRVKRMLVTNLIDGFFAPLLALLELLAVAGFKLAPLLLFIPDKRAN